MDFFDQQNEKFYEFLRETFLIHKAKSWSDISKNVTKTKVRQTYRFFAKLYPRKANYLVELEKSKTEFSSIHYGLIKANSIINEVVRFSLYSDKIFVFHPLQNPSVTNQSMDPRNNPLLWLTDFLDALYFYIVIQKWVKAGIVKLIVNPYDYDDDLKKSLESVIEKRAQKLLTKNYTEEDLGSSKRHMAEHLAPIYKGKSKDFIIKNILSWENPRFTKLEAEEFAKLILDSEPFANPLFKDLNIKQSQGTLLPSKGGGPIESILKISQVSGANIYTPDNSNWNQLKEIGQNDFWTKLNRFYSNIPLNFLNNVDSSFALEIRKDNRLAGVRQELKKIYNDLGSININDINESHYRDLNEGFIEELKKAESEWTTIKKLAENSRKYWLSANLGIPFIQNELTLFPLIAGSFTWLYYNEKSNKAKMKNFKVQNPISIYVDLKNQRQSFLTEIKNCII